MAMYESEFTRFLREFKEKNPAVEVGQKQGRGLLWDRQIDAEAQQAYREARVPMKPYVYQTDADN